MYLEGINAITRLLQPTVHHLDGCAYVSIKSVLINYFASGDRDFAEGVARRHVSNEPQIQKCAGVSRGDESYKHQSTTANGAP
jgi:hypothetical protein